MTLPVSLSARNSASRFDLTQKQDACLMTFHAEEARRNLVRERSPRRTGEQDHPPLRKAWDAAVGAEQPARRLGLGRRTVLLLNRAGWRMSDKLHVPGNLTLIPLPAKCPEPRRDQLAVPMRSWLSNRIFLITISSITAARPGTNSHPSHGASSPSDCANGPIRFDQRKLVLPAYAAGFVLLYPIVASSVAKSISVGDDPGLPQFVAP
jgi:hypothetical protein